MSRGNRSDRRGVSKCYQALAPARRHADPGDRPPHGPVPQYRPQVPCHQKLEPSYPERKSPSKLDDYEETLTNWLFRESRRHRKQRRTARSCTGTCSVSATPAPMIAWRPSPVAGARRSRRPRLEASKRPTCRCSLPGEAFQFDWSEDWIKINGISTKLQVAHFKLSYSRALHAGLPDAVARDAV
jgi:hypothetical protein